MAIDDGSGVPVLKAYVVSEQGGPELAQVLLRLCRSRLAGFKVPQSYDFLDELPRTPSGNVRRFLLRGLSCMNRRSTDRHFDQGMTWQIDPGRREPP